MLGDVEDPTKEIVFGGHSIGSPTAEASMIGLSRRDHKIISKRNHDVQAKNFVFPVNGDRSSLSSRRGCCQPPAPGNFGYQSYLSFLTLGIIYGDIGTSPLYTFSTIFTSPPTEAQVLGGLSMMLWSLIIVVITKYIIFVLLADDHGEGGTFALLALINRNIKNDSKSERILHTFFSTIAIIGCACILADGVLTPAVSVVGAVQGLAVASPNVTPGVVVGVSCAILFLFFLPQSYGTSKVSFLFSPIIVVWFFALASIGIYNITLAPQVLQAFNPAYGFNFVAQGYDGWASLGAIFLTITGTEALYADLGHFNARAVRTSALVLVLPALMLCYCGQAAALIRDPSIITNTFYLGLPQGLFYPMLILATLAAIIASQAMVSATFSIIAQAIKLNYFPRLTVRHTNRYEVGQVYIPEINWFLMILIIIIIIGFGNGYALGNAYGVTVSSAMFVTTILYSGVIVYHFKRHWIFALTFLMIFGFIDLCFLSSNLLKFVYGGWFSVVMTVILTIIIGIWRWGRKLMIKKQDELTVPHDAIFKAPFDGLHDVPGLNLLICLSSNPEAIPGSFVHFVERVPVLPKKLVFVTLTTETLPFVESNLKIVPISGHPDIFVATVHYGYVQNPPSPVDLVAEISKLIHANQTADFMTLPNERVYALVNPTFLMSKDSVSIKGNRFRQALGRLFDLLLNFSNSPIASFEVPVNSKLEVGLVVAI